MIVANNYRLYNIIGGAGNGRIKRNGRQPIIRKAQMELPFDLPQLLSHLRLNVAGVLLPCVFCGGVCGLQDNFDFCASGLKVVWKNGYYHIACKRCRRQAAAAEDHCYRQCHGESDFVEACTGLPLLHVDINCIACLGKLGATEKLLARETRRPFILVRNRWRGYCRNCFVL